MVYSVCPDCDLLVPHQALALNEHARCARCNAVLYQNAEAMLLKSLVYSLSALLLYFPATFLPMLNFAVLNQNSETAVFSGVVNLYQQGFYGVALLVFFCAVLAPAICLLLIFVISLALHLGHAKPWIKTFIIWHNRLKEWSMLEVYLLGVLVSYIKIMNLGEVVFGIGLLCFVAMLVMAILATSRFDTHSAFDFWESKYSYKEAAV